MKRKINSARRMNSVAIFWLVAAQLIGATARGQNASAPAPESKRDESSKPILQIEPGGHTASVHRVFFTPDGKQLISLGFDKVIRIWDVATGEVVRQLRGQIGPGLEGTMLCVALSPDKKTLAAAGVLDAPTGPRVGAIRLFDIQSGQIMRSLETHTHLVTALAFSPDGSTLASGGGDKTVRLWDVVSGTVRHVLPVASSPIYDILWSPDGRHIAADSDENTISIWEAATGQVARILKHESRVLSAEWSPDGKTIASSSQDRVIRLWDAEGGQLRHALPPQENAVNSLSFSPDGRRLASGLGGGDGKGFSARVWALPEGSMQREFTAHDNTVQAVAFSPDGRTIASAGGYHNDIYLWDADSGAVRRHLIGTGAAIGLVSWSTDGQRISWGGSSKSGASDAFQRVMRVFNLALAAPEAEASKNSRWQRTATESGQFRLSRSEDKLKVMLTQGEKEIARFEDSGTPIYGYSFASGGVLLAKMTSLQLLDFKGDLLKDFIGHDGEIWDIALSPDGKYFASASVDQTVRIWSLQEKNRSRIGIQFDEKNQCLVHKAVEGWPAALAGIKAGDVVLSINGEPMKTTEQATAAISGKTPGERFVIKVQRGEQTLEFSVVSKPLWMTVYPLLSIFMGNDREWVAWTPQGYYACSPKAERVVGWHLNRGRDKAADFYPAYQFRKQFYRPDVIQKLLSAGSVEKALAEADAIRKQKTDAQLVAGNLEKFAPPKVEILTPTEGSTLPALSATVKARITDPNGRAIKAVNLLVNGRDSKAIALGDKAIAIGDKPIAIGDKPIAVGDKPLPAGEWEESAPLVPGENTLSVVAINDAGAESLPATIKITSRAQTQKPDLYLLSVGVSRYQDEKYSLAYAAKDASDFGTALLAQQNKRFGKVQLRSLTDGKADKAAILNGLEWLKKQVKQDDWAILFLSGHGFRNKNEYVFAPHDIDPDLLELTGLSWSELRDGLRLPGRVLLVLDTCRAGGAGGGLAYNDALREARDNGLITLASCLPNEVSRENKEWSNGAFTKALVEALNGKADSDGDGAVTLGETDGYISNRVKELTNDGQHPSSPRPTGVPSGLTLAMLK